MVSHDSIQMHDYRESTIEVLQQYGVAPLELKYLGQRDTVTLQVITTNDIYLLKIHSECQQICIIESELLWLEALCRDTDNLIVPEPVRNKGGDLVTTIRINGIGSLIATLLRWVDGEILNRQPNPLEVTQLAEAMATLHIHSTQWQRPEGFKRPLYDSESLLKTLAKLALLLTENIITQSHYEIIETTIHRIISETSKLDISCETWGLIHSDLHESNYVVNTCKVHPIDFSCCGFGYYLFDVSESLLHLSPDNRLLFVEAYKQRRSLPSVNIRTLEVFFLWQIIRGFAFHSINPDEYKWLSDEIPKVTSYYCQKFIAGEPFLFT